MTPLFSLFLASAEHEGGSQMEILGINSSGLIAQFIVFGLLAFLLKKYAFDPILEVMDQRRKQIEQSLANADKIKKELAEAQSTRKDIITKANAEATALIVEAQKAAAIQGEKKLQEAIAQAEAVMAKAREATALDRATMLADLRREVSSLVIATTEKVSGKVLNADDQRRLTEETTATFRN
jgi:F-type H+-transporting ATPase subunit b